jgi:hypothetical protein
VGFNDDKTKGAARFNLFRVLASSSKPLLFSF